MIKEDITDAMEVMQDCINKFHKRIADKKKGLAAAVELGVTDGKELKAEIKAAEGKIKAFRTAYSVLNEKLENITENEYLAEKHLQTDAEPPSVTPSTYECPHCGVVYYRKPFICYNGCKKRMWENDGKRSSIS
ncbi:MAG: hypothetical protein ACI4EA_12455 [Candidatus Ornithomonoglobus sp.]